jgi:hypothetical protein
MAETQRPTLELSAVCEVDPQAVRCGPGKRATTIEWRDAVVAVARCHADFLAAVHGWDRRRRAVTATSGEQKRGGGPHVDGRAAPSASELCKTHLQALHTVASLNLGYGAAADDAVLAAVGRAAGLPVGSPGAPVSVWQVLATHISRQRGRPPLLNGRAAAGRNVPWCETRQAVDAGPSVKVGPPHAPTRTARGRRTGRAAATRVRLVPPPARSGRAGW